jgi:hypothetical protein
VKKSVFVCIAILSITFTVYAEEEVISTFDEKWTISPFLNYNMGIFQQSNADRYRTNKPWNLGLGIRYKKISGKISFPLSFSSGFSLDFDINSYFNKIFYRAYIKYYNDFYVHDTSENSGLDAFTSGLMATYVQNHKNHSLSSVINLDKRQNVSSGSMLYGLGTFYTSMYSQTQTMSNYAEKQNLLYFGPSIGYSYIWVFQSGLFLNASILGFTNVGRNLSSNKWLIIPQVEPRIVFGHHNDTWSFNITLMNNSTILFWNNAGFSYDALTLLTLSTMFSKRF